MFILAIILAVIAVIGLIVGIAARSGVGFGVFGVFLAAGIVLGIFSSVYSLNTGEAGVVKSYSGQILGSDSTPGFHSKSPFSSVIKYDIRNQSVQFAADKSNNPTGPQVTVQDADGVSDNIDISVNYSIDPSAIKSIYQQYHSEDAFKQQFVERDIRDIVRNVPNKFHTLDLLTKRADVETAITKALEQRWADAGVHVDNVALQEIRVPSSVSTAYSDAQKSQIAVTKAQNDLKAAQVEAQQQVAQAQAQAQANADLSASLTPEILEQRYIDALGKSNTIYVVPQSGNQIVQLPTPTK